MVEPDTQTGNNLPLAMRLRDILVTATVVKWRMPHRCTQMQNICQR